MQHSPKFRLGEVVSTPAALDALCESGDEARQLIERHQHGDYGDICPEDWLANDHAILHGARILSSYLLRTGVKLWIITEADRSSTTLLLPEDY